MRESTTPQEQLDFIGNVRHIYPYNNTYNEGWCQHPNFSLVATPILILSRHHQAFRDNHYRPARANYNKSILFKGKLFLTNNSDNFRSRTQPQ
ncbi:unnamed protein product [Linum trigynum]|uniref:Uncharacterized protein n=1 Tax=Linum trigynum TaxID=586398 RepID=A0AAV2GA37_9ROSI